MRKTLAQLCIIIAFLGVALLGLFSLRKSNHPIPIESFTGTAPKRADQCRCLPGFIPSKDTSGIYTCKNLIDSTISKKCY
jgi:hypothetical protein